MVEVSPQRRRILDYLGQFLEEHGYPPTVRDIARALGISSTSVVHYHLRELEQQGRIRRAPQVSRGIEVLSLSRREPGPALVPVVGIIAAGEPIEAVERDHELVSVPRGLVAGVDAGELFALRVRGDSMVEDLIGDGDLVVVQRQATARDGEIVVALLTEGPTDQWNVTLKRFYRQGDIVRLQPANSQMESILVPADRVRVQGKVVALIRRFA